MMKIRLILFLCGFFFMYNAHSQVLLLNLKLGDCISCYQSLEKLRKDDHIPWIGVFPTSYRIDSVDLVDRYNLDVLKIPVLFNDLLYNNTKSKQDVSTLSFMAVDGRIIWTKYLEEVSYNIFADSLIEIFNKERGYKLREREIWKSSKAHDFAFNYATGTVRYWPKNDPQNLVWIRPSGLTKEKLSENLPKTEKALLFKSWDVVKNSPVYSNIIKWIELDRKGDAYLLFNYYSYYTDADTSLNQRFSIIKQNVRYNTNSVYPIMFNELHNYHIGFFILKDSSTLYFLTSDSRKNIRDLVKNNNLPIYNLAEYKLKDNEYRFNKLEKFDLPPVYRSHFLYNDFSLNFSRYPFIGYRHSNIIYNIETGETIDILKSDPVYQSLKRKYGSKFLIDNLSLEPIMVDSRSGNVLITYKLGKSSYTLLYSPELKLLHKTNLDDLLQYFKIRAGKIDFIMVDYNANALMVYCEHDFIKLPITIFL